MIIQLFVFNINHTQFPQFKDILNLIYFQQSYLKKILIPLK